MILDVLEWQGQTLTLMLMRMSRVDARGRLIGQPSQAAAAARSERYDGRMLGLGVWSIKSGRDVNGGTPGMPGSSLFVVQERFLSEGGNDISESWKVEALASLFRC